jgi:hypothetical protein
MQLKMISASQPGSQYFVQIFRKTPKTVLFNASWKAVLFLQKMGA